MHELMHFYDPSENDEREIQATAIAFAEACIEDASGDKTIFENIHKYLLKSMKFM